ncbi:M20/M25/M40 family metallo-hydrolase [uncultured Megasphaera sp.]|uniref:M20/M25/M40 family metallo-hydrolase n=1 Tax=uncultured Megasphaera sp. TaxID=165188 RepID=UPI0025DAF8D3|nr:M20/M25/M40 family metallo-hydrolase [uncultured Megasphaera sp.]
MVEATRVMEILQAMIRIDSETNTSKERKMEQFLQQFFQKTKGVTSGLIHVPDDPCRRSVVYGLLRGETGHTVIFMNHHDVVDTESYGKLRDLAFAPQELQQVLAGEKMRDDVRQDLESGEWLFGRGSCDMKGGAAAQLAVFEDYAEKVGKASLLYLSLPDEETYSAGMRAAIGLLDELRTSYDLTYDVLIDSEPNHKEKGQLVAYTGSVGKIQPVVLVQGKPVHIGHYTQGLNPVGVLARLVAATEGKQEFTDSCGTEVTPPPAWVYLRDRKERYDVTLPQRAAAALNLLTYDKTPDDVMYFLLEETRCAVSDMLQTMQSGLDVPVLSAAELLQQASSYEGFDVFYEAAKQASFVALQDGRSTYAEETLSLIEKTLDFMDLKQPLAVVAFAPPYYPAADSLSFPTPAFQGLLQHIQTLTDVRFERYFNGVSDCSYCCVDPAFDDKMVEKNLLLWGKAYPFDLENLKKLQIPFLLLGPWGKDLHEGTERVNIASVSRDLPRILEAVLAYVGRENFEKVQ